jgi:hypothetical protein
VQLNAVGGNDVISRGVAKRLLTNPAGRKGRAIEVDEEEEASGEGTRALPQEHAPALQIAHRHRDYGLEYAMVFSFFRSGWHNSGTPLV